MEWVGSSGSGRTEGNVKGIFSLPYNINQADEMEMGNLRLLAFIHSAAHTPPQTKNHRFCYSCSAVAPLLLLLLLPIWL